MRFGYLFLADAANNGPDGKVNLLGVGLRLVTPRSLPASIAMTVAGSIEASVKEAGDYALEIAIRRKGGRPDVLLTTTAAVPGEVSDPRVPTGVAFILSTVRTFEAEGVYEFIAKFGSVSARYAFVVRPPIAAEADHEGT